MARGVFGHHANNHLALTKGKGGGYVSLSIQYPVGSVKMHGTMELSLVEEIEESEFDEVCTICALYSSANTLCALLML